MLVTPGRNRGQPSLGEPSRVGRLRDQSPGASSIDSFDTGFTTPARGRGHGHNGNHGAGACSRHSTVRSTVATRHSRDPRPVGERTFASQCARNVVEFLGMRAYSKSISHDKFMKDPSTKEFFDIFRFLISQIDPQLELEGKLDDEVPAIMRRLKYPVEVNRSKLQAICGPNTWPQLLAVLDWLVALIKASDEVVDPTLACHTDVDDVENLSGENRVLRSLQENYVQYLGGKDDRSDEDRLRQIYQERKDACRAEIGRLQAQHARIECQTHEFRSEHDRLLELQSGPRNLQIEADRLRGLLQSKEAQVQHTEDEDATLEAEGNSLRIDLEDRQAEEQSLSQQVDRQTHSKKDIERLKCERDQIRQMLHESRQDGEKIEQHVWELGISEKRLEENIGRLARRVNETVEASLSKQAARNDGDDKNEFLIHVDLAESINILGAKDFSRQQGRIEALIQTSKDSTQSEELARHELSDKQRLAQEELSERERETRRKQVRLEQLGRMREEYKAWSAKELDDVEQMAAASEDAVHAAAIGGAVASSVRDAAEIDKLRLTVSELHGRNADETNEEVALVERDIECISKQKLQVCSELGTYAESVEHLLESVEKVLQESDTQHGLRSRQARNLGGS